MKAQLGTFNQKQALVVAFSVIVKSSRRFVWSSTGDPPDVVHGDVGGVDEGDGDAGGVEAGEVEPDQEVAARVHLDGANLG